VLPADALTCRVRNLFYNCMGKVGGVAVAWKYSLAFYGEIGRKGGSSTITRKGLEHYARIGK
jgi:hypothetical protein